MAEHAHCLHEIQRASYRQGEGGHQTITSRCCHCGELAHERLVFRRDPAHGQYAPLVLVPE